MGLADCKVDCFGRRLRHADDDLIRHELGVRRLLTRGRSVLVRRILGRLRIALRRYRSSASTRERVRPERLPLRRTRTGKDAAAEVLPAFPGTAAALAI